MARYVNGLDNGIRPHIGHCERCDTDPARGFTVSESALLRDRWICGTYDGEPICYAHIRKINFAGNRPRA